MEPSRWQLWHFSCKMGAMSFANVTGLLVSSAALKSIGKVASETRVLIAIICLLLFGPQDPLVLLGNRSQTFVHESLHALSAIGFGGVDVALGIRGDTVDRVELAGLAAAVAEAGQDFHRLAQHDVNLLVGSVRQVDVLLLRILGERDVPRRPVAERVLGDEYFLDELAVRSEYLNAIVHAVADVQHAVARKLDAVHRVAELLRDRS